MNKTQQHDLINISSLPAAGPSAQPSRHLPFNQPSTTLEKSSMSFFKRPIRMRRDKKAPPSPLTVCPAPSAISPQIPQAPSSSTGTKFNSLLTAAARSIRTGDSRQFESFQAAVSPKPIQSQSSSSHPCTQKSINIHSLKRIPVPSYTPLQNRSHHQPDLLTRPASLAQSKTAPKHSRTTSLPSPQGPPTLDPLSNSLWKSRSHQDLAESPQKTSGLEQESVELFERLPRSSPIHLLSTLNLQSEDQVAESKSDLNQTSSPFDSVLFNIAFSTHSHEPGSSTPLSTHRTGSNISFEQSPEIASNASGNSSRNDHHRPLSASICGLLRLGSQISLPISFRASSSNPLSKSYSSAGSGLESNHRSNDFLEPEKTRLTTRDAQRRSFQNMPLPALPPPFSQKQCKGFNSALLELPPSLNPRQNQTTRFQLARKPRRPWSIASPGIRNGEDGQEKSLCIHETSISKTNSPTSADQSIFHPSRRSPLKLSTLNRKNRHSYPSQSIPNVSPLERVSDHMKSVYSTSRTFQKPQCVTLPVFDAGSIGRKNEALRLAPSITSPCGNLMFGFRGEVYESDKYRKLAVLDRSTKVLMDSDDRDPHILSSQPSPHPKSTQNLFEQTSTTCDSIGRKDDSLTGSLPGSSNSSGASPILPKSLILHPSHQPNVVPNSSIKPQPEFEELGEFIELREICLMGSDPPAHPAESPGAGTDDLNTARETIVIEHSSPRNSERNCSTETVLESLSVDRGSSEEESSRLLEESVKFESGPEPKIINPDTSLEMAASILGQPVPSISSEIRQGFARIRHLLSDGRSKESAEKDKQDFMSKMLKSIDHKIDESLKTSDSATQTDPVEFVTGRNNNNNHSLFQHSSTVIPEINNRRMADALKKLMHRGDISETRHSIQSEKSLVSAYRNYGVFGAKEDQQESVRTSSTLMRSPRSDYQPERPVSMMHRLSELSDPSRRFSSTWTNLIHAPQQHAQHSPLRNNTAEFHLGLQTNSSTLNESVMDALDKALRAEESFQREKQHLQSVARRQSQTIESLLIDKEVLSLEVSRLTGLVELLARDHNLLNDRIDKAEQAFEKLPTSSNQASAHRSLTPDDTINYFTAAGETTMVSKGNDDMKEDVHWLKNRSRKRNRGNSTETDDGIMAGDSDYWEDGQEEDAESLCDPEQSVIHFSQQRLSFEFVIETSKDNLEPIPGAYPLLTPSKPCTLAKHTPAGS